MFRIESISKNIESKKTEIALLRLEMLKPYPNIVKRAIDTRMGVLLRDMNKCIEECSRREKLKKRLARIN
jgi:hypothetical protein